MTRSFVTASILIASLCLGPPVLAQTARITLRGSIVEGTCPLRDGRPACPADRSVRAEVRSSMIDPAALPFDASLLAYAVWRGGEEASHGWRLVEIAWP